MNYNGQYQCDPNHIVPGSLGRGVTTWELSSPFTIAPGATHYESFTCTIPKCYFNNDSTLHGQDSCNITFSAYANSPGSSGNDISLTYKLNGSDCGGCYVSRQQGHGGWQTWDISQATSGGTHLYNDMAFNNFGIRNNGDVTVTIQYFRVLRIYKMCNITAEQYCSDDTAPCYGEHSVTNNGTMDYVRVDKPCNYESCGIWSVTLADDSTYQNSTLQPGQSFSWTFDWSNYSKHNYYGSQKCLFNFNQVWSYTTSTRNDVQLDAYINDQYVTSFYLSKINNHGMFPSFDLVLNNTAYNDSGSNTIKLTNNSNNDVYIQMAPNPGNGINIYRVFVNQTPCNPSPYSDIP